MTLATALKETSPSPHVSRFTITSTLHGDAGNAADDPDDPDASGGDGGDSPLRTLRRVDQWRVVLYAARTTPHTLLQSLVHY